MSQALLTSDILSRLARFRLRARAPRQGRASGAYRSKMKGISMDLAGYRPYVLGDDLRWVDWAIYARTEKLHMKTFFEEQDSPVMVLLDMSGSMGLPGPEKWFLARQMAAAVGAVALMGQNPLWLGLIHEDRLERRRIGRGAKHLGRYLSILEGLQPAGKTRLSDAARKSLMALPPSLLYLISDGFDPAGLERTLQALSSGGHEGTWLQVLHEQEINPPLEGDALVADVETGESLAVSFDEEGKRRFDKYLLDRLTFQRRTALYRGILYAKILTNQEIGPVLFQLFNGQLPGVHRVQGASEKP